MEREWAFVLISLNKTNYVACHPNKLFENDFKLHGQDIHGREGVVMPNEVFKNDTISNIKETEEQENKLESTLLTLLILPTLSIVQ